MNKAVTLAIAHVLSEKFSGVKPEVGIVVDGMDPAKAEQLKTTLIDAGCTVREIIDDDKNVFMIREPAFYSKPVLDNAHEYLRQPYVTYNKEPSVYGQDNVKNPSRLFAALMSRLK